MWGNFKNQSPTSKDLSENIYADETTIRTWRGERDNKIYRSVADNGLNENKSIFINTLVSSASIRIYT